MSFPACAAAVERLENAAVTANAFEGEHTLAYEAGRNGHLAKPYDIPEMLKSLKELLDTPAETGV